MAEYRKTHHKCPECGHSMFLRGGRYEESSLSHMMEVAQCEHCGHSIDIRLFGASSITKEEALFQDARRALLLSLSAYCYHVASVPKPCDDEGIKVWDWCEERYGYDLRVRAGLYASRAFKAGIS